MAAVSSNPETARYYATQAGLGVATVQSLASLWPLLDPARLAEIIGHAEAVAAAVAAQNSKAAISLAADYYDSFRSAHASGRFSQPITDPKPLDVLQAELDAQVSQIRDSLNTVVDEVYLGQIALQFQAQLEGFTQSVVADAGRDQLFEAMRADEAARGWARIARPTACSFCRMLASRGPVYSEDTVTFRAHTPINGRGGTCQCTAEPLIGNSYEPTAQARADAALWDRIAAEGFRGADARNEFRRHIEGRATGSRRPRGRDGRKPVEVQGQKLGFDHLSPTQLRHQLAVIESLKDSDYRTKQIARIKSRLLALGA